METKTSLDETKLLRYVHNVEAPQIPNDTVDDGTCTQIKGENSIYSNIDRMIFIFLVPRTGSV